MGKEWAGSGQEAALAETWMRVGTADTWAETWIKGQQLLPGLTPDKKSAPLPGTADAFPAAPETHDFAEPQDHPQ